MRRRSISGITRFSIAGMWTFIIQSRQSMASGAQRSFFLSASDARANAARVFEQSKGPLSSDANGSKSRWISAIFCVRFDASSRAFAAGASAGIAPRTKDASPLAALAIAGGPTRSNRARPTKLGSMRAARAARSGFPPSPPRWKNLRLYIPTISPKRWAVHGFTSLAPNWYTGAAVPSTSSARASSIPATTMSVGMRSSGTCPARICTCPFIIR